MTEWVETLRLGDFDRHGTTRARVAGRWIEIEHGIPGELVRAEITGTKRPRGHILEVLEPATDRVEPPCPYFREWACGGCQWQHISYDGQVRRKQEAVRSALVAAGLELPITAMHTLEDPWRYRSTAGIALGRRAGFRRQASLAIVPIRACPISHPIIGRLMARLNDDLEAGAVPDFRGRVRIEVRLTGSPPDERLLALVQPDPALPAPPAELAVLNRRLTGYPEVAGLTVRRPGGALHHEWGERFGSVEVAGRTMVVDAAAFFQTTLRLLPALIDRIRTEAGPLGGRVVADLYGGVGLFGLFLADEAARVIVMESNPAAVQAGTRTSAAWGLDNVQFVTGEVEAGLDHLADANVVVLDPPRSGLSAPLREGLLAARPATILYVSCLAESLARDLVDLLAGGYRVDHLELFDFYPQTYHVEVLAVLREG